MDIKEFNKGYMEKRAFIGTPIGALIGALQAQKGKGWEGAAYGALRGLGADIGAAHGMTPGLLAGALPGLVAGGTLGAHPVPAMAGAGFGAGLGALGGAGLGGYLGYKISDPLLRKIWSEKEMEEIFGK
jgi:hypothetical protein